MARIFISYRRDDSIAYAGRIYDRLIAHFRSDEVFIDIDTLEPGVDFVTVLEQTVESCDILLAVIGKQWLTAKDEEGNPRLFNPEDFVSLEIGAALGRPNTRVIPVLVGGARMPRSIELPEKLLGLSRRQAFELPDIGFHQAFGRLIGSIERILEERLKQEQADAARRAELERLKQEQADAARRAELKLVKQEQADAVRRAEQERLKQEQADAVRRAALERVKQEQADAARRAEQERCGSECVEIVAKLPRPAVLGHLLYLIKAPAERLVRVIQANAQQIVTAVNAPSQGITAVVAAPAQRLAATIDVVGRIRTAGSRGQRGPLSSKSAASAN